MDIFHFIPGYSHYIFDSGREPAFVMLATFIITFAVVRTFTRRRRGTQKGRTFIHGVHAHHLVFGMVLAFAAGAVEFAFSPVSDTATLFLAALFGMGVAVVLDEFALVFHLQDVYWERQGRKSIDAIVVAAGFGLLFLLHTSPFQNYLKLPIELQVLLQVGNLIVVLIAASKGKLASSVFGVFIPPLAILGSIRLAEPSSLWARRFYPTNGRQHRRAVKRYVAYRKRWHPIKERVWDLLGGSMSSQVDK
ncbi:MAG: hypothetical protein ACOH18_02705 [Candidatus Saccharimonadaceae bacterium]